MTVSHQTVRLQRGKHSDPEEGVCVMELVSMLAGEEFTDHPQSACPVIGTFLRTYNDAVDEDRRQDLYAYAAEVVGTRANRQVEVRRARLCRDWLASLDAGSGGRKIRNVFLTLRSSRRDAPAHHAARAAADDPSRHEAALALLRELIAVGRQPRGDLAALLEPGGPRRTPISC